MVSAVRGGSVNSRFLWLGNHVALDFLNTEPMMQGEAVDLLPTLADLADWGGEAELLYAAEWRAALPRWPAAESRRVLARAHDLRARLRETVERLCNGKSASSGLLEAINALLQRRAGYSELVRKGGRVERRFHLRPDEPVHLLVPLAEAIGDFLCHADFALLKRCQNPACVLYFYDVSKNHARRWCSMQLCGNRLKVAAHYRRRRSG
jgi:predicted RNA-binding Zn ribbon-like protein